MTAVRPWINIETLLVTADLVQQAPEHPVSSKMMATTMATRKNGHGWDGEAGLAGAIDGCSALRALAHLCDGVLCSAIIMIVPPR